MNLTAHDQEVLEQVRLIVDSIKERTNGESELVSFLREQIEFEREIRRYNTDINRENAEANAKRAASIERLYAAIIPMMIEALKVAMRPPRPTPAFTPPADSELPPLPDGIRRERCTECKCAMLVADGQNKVVCPACLSVFGDDSIASETSAEPTG